jgi:uncharacterized protein (DUF924 family)
VSGPHHQRIQRIFEFWFGALDEKGSPSVEHSARWWRKDPAFDAAIAEEFGADIERASRGELDDWKETPRGRLALVILLDQFSRNVYRDTPRAFANDARALALAEEGIERGEDRELSVVERSFLYMPLMHAENLAVQERAVAVFRRANEELEGSFEQALEYAIRHRDIVARFGRFPHRNAILGREPTPEEVEFLKQPGSSF